MPEDAFSKASLSAVIQATETSMSEAAASSVLAEDSVRSGNEGTEPVTIRSLQASLFAAQKELELVSATLESERAQSDSAVAAATDLATQKAQDDTTTSILELRADHAKEVASIRADVLSSARQAADTRIADVQKQH